jgi:hypothetical protein
MAISDKISKGGNPLTFSEFDAAVASNDVLLVEDLILVRPLLNCFFQSRSFWTRQQ